MSRTLDDILGRPEREEVAAAQPQAGDYTAFTTNPGGRPGMAFDVVHANGNHDGFPYLDIKFPRFQLTEGEEAIGFVYCGMAVKITGRKLEAVYDALISHRLRQIHEHRGQPVEEGNPVVTKIKMQFPEPQQRSGPKADPKLTLIEPDAKAS